MVTFDSRKRVSYSRRDAVDKAIAYTDRGFGWDIRKGSIKFVIPGISRALEEHELLERIDGSLAAEDSRDLAIFYTDALSIAEQFPDFRRTRELHGTKEAA